MAHPDLLDLQDLKDSKDPMVNLESQALLVLLALEVPLDLMESRERMVSLENMARLESVAHLDLRELVGSPELLDFQGSRDTGVTLD